MGNEITALEVLSNVLKGGQHQLALELRQVPPAPNLQQRIGAESRSEDFSRARTLSHEEGIPFWHSVFRIGSQASAGVSPAVLEAALYSQSTEHFSYVTADEFFVENATSAVAEADPNVYIVASSAVDTDDGKRHIPMLDFSTKERWPGALDTAVGSVRALGLPGTLLASGRSFHFIGGHFLTWENYSRFLYRALLLAPIVDERWVAHQLLAGNATLRVSPNSHGEVPRQVARIV